MILPPGTILQMMYLKERLRGHCPGNFIEVGVGQGHVSWYLLGLGWHGTGYELDADSAQAARRCNAEAMRDGRYEVINGDWLHASVDERPDLIISSMVLEHLDDDKEGAYLRRCSELLAPDGLCVLFVPGSPRDWGIEDEVAGHYRRYDFARLQAVTRAAGCEIKHMVGLTYPLSNILLPISNHLVRRHEGDHRALSMTHRTQASGRRKVAGKTSFPAPFQLLLNEITLYPFYLLQKLFRNDQRALVIYVECAPHA